MIKNPLFILLIGVIILIYLCKHDIRNFMTTKYINAIDGKKYPIVGEFSESNKAANLLANINKFLIDVIKNMKRKYVTGNKGGNFEYTATMVLLNRYNPDVLFENNPVGIVNTSYVENKGTSIGFCLREKESGKNNLHKWPIIQYVALHEISHIITVGNGHDLDFWRNFKFMITEAVDAGLYSPIDYKKNPETYCKVSVMYSPYFDETL